MRPRRDAPTRDDGRGLSRPRPAPVRWVERELTRPDGTKIRARVPVYPPFSLDGEAERPARRSRRG